MGVFSKIHRYRNAGENTNVNNLERFGWQLDRKSHGGGGNTSGGSSSAN